MAEISQHEDDGLIRYSLSDLHQKTSQELQSILIMRSRMPPELVDCIRRVMQQRQRHSFARAEAGIGSDADELAFREALARGDTEETARLDAEIKERIAAFVARFPEVQS